MAQRKMKHLEGESKASIAQKARRAKELATISKLADENLAITDEWRVLRPEHIEAIRVRLLGGDTLGNVCRELGIDRGHVNQYVYNNPEFAKEVLSFKAFGSHALMERLIEMIDDKTMTTGDKMFAYKVIANYAGKMNRDTYGDRSTLDVAQTVTIQMPVWAKAEQKQDVIDAEAIDPDLLHEQQTVKRLTGEQQKPDASDPHEQ